MTLKKTIAGFVVAAIAFFGMAAPTNAQTIEELLAQIAELTALVNSLQGGGSTGSSSSCNFVYTGVLKQGSTGSSVMSLQSALGLSLVDGIFGSGTKAAVMSFQSANGLMADGIVGPMTANKLNMNCSMDDDDDDDDDDNGSMTLQGGAGSIDDVDYLSDLTSEEVGEDEEDVEVAGIRIEADNNSDLMITAVNLNFSQGTADSDFDKYASEVSIWFEGEEVARLDADDFEEDDNFDKTVSLDNGAIIEAGETGDLVVAVSGISNLDSNDATETWTLEFESVRFRDAQGAIITDTSTGDINDGSGRTFSFENFATAADVELKISLSDNDDINDAHIIDVHATEATDNVSVFEFEMEVEGNSDISLDDFSIEATITGATYIDDLVDNLDLYMDGEKVDSMQPPTDENTILFDDLDLELDAGDTHTFLVKADFLAVSGALDEGDTLYFTIGETETDLATTDIDDENGDALADADITGSATSDASAVHDIFIDVDLVSADHEVLSDGAGGNDDDSITFTLVFDITAEGGDVYVGDTATATTVADGSFGTGLATDGIVYRVYDSGTATTDDLADLITFTTPAGVTDSTDNIFITEGSTSRVTLTVTNTNNDADDDGIYYLDIAGFGWGIADDTTYEFVYTYDLEDFETSATYID